MRVLLATSEAVPFAKTGGLADVCGVLPSELAKLGHEAALIMPAYRQIHAAGLPIQPMGVEFELPLGSKRVRGRLLHSHLPGSDCPVYFVQNDEYFDRPELYRHAGADYRDNCERFVFFSRAVLAAAVQLDLGVDLFHCNDWQTGLIPAYLKIEHATHPRLGQAASLMTVHNLAYQGTFWNWDMLLTGLDWKYFNWQQMEFFGDLNLLKTGLVFADRINTVSPTYAQEIQSAPLGCGLEGVLQQRRHVLSGIINGIDEASWNPAIDRHLLMQYDADNYAAGKAACKAALQAQFGLPAQPRTPLVAFIGRLADQKGIDLIAAVMRQWIQQHDAQWVILGTGEPRYHELFEQLAQQYPAKVAVRLMFSDALAHQIEAGADIFLMPSRYEPCGLNQLYSLKYGTAPVVRATGGLVDTIVNATPQAIADRRATGFVFQDYSVVALAEALHRAVDVYLHHPQTWQRIIQTGMRQDWSWTHSARQYAALYQQTLDQARHTVRV